MTPDFKICDICGDKVEKSLTLFVATGRSMDASGNGYETDGYHVDLCHVHALHMLNALLHPTNTRVGDYQRGEFLMEKIHAAKAALQDKHSHK